jgi:3-isopropylmalate/(R)-2-methylmalate dehydratase small subunit
MNNLQGLRVRCVQGVISTDDILPARYKHMTTNPRELSTHLFENIGARFGAPLTPGSAIVATDVFGVGSSREQAVSALRAADVRAILSPAFGEILYRNCWNLGLPALKLDTSGLEDGDLVDIDLVTGVLRDPLKGSAWSFAHVPDPLLRLLRCGGLIPMVKEFGGLRG